MLNTNENSTITVYISSHAGEEYIKIQDTDVITTEDFARAITEMHTKGRYKQLVIFLETCRAFTFFNNLKAPNTFVVGSSNEGEDTMSHTYHSGLGLVVNDEFTFYFMDFMTKHYNNNSTLADIFNHLRKNIKSSTVMARNNLKEDMSKVLFINEIGKTK